MREKYNGILVIDKDKGYTSHDVVARLRGITGQRKIGHTGTLDPEATGVLPVGLGNATKLNDLLIDKKKCYRVRMILGVTTDSQDMTGTVLTDVGTCLEAHDGLSCSKNDACSEGGHLREEYPTGNVISLKESDITEAALSFVGGYDQEPPMYSAVRIGGKRLYELARQGVEIERETRWVDIDRIDVESVTESDGHVEAVMSVDCSKGTYIRTLCNDIGKKLGCGACVGELKRLQVGRFSIGEAHTLAEVEEMAKAGRLESLIVPTDSCLEGYGRGYLKESADRFLLSGNMVGTDDFERLESERSREGILVYDSHGEFMATYVYSRRFKSYKPKKMFL